MEEIICYSRLLSPGETRMLTFWDIFMNDNWAEGEFTCPNSVYCEIGNINQQLRTKQNYEFLLRAAEKYPIKAVGYSSPSQNTPDAWEAFRTDCYIVGKYCEKLRQNNYFDAIVTRLLEQASSMSWYQEGISFLEKMISHTPEYYAIDDNTRPILLYRGEDTCYNILNIFIDSLGRAFQQCRQRVEFFDVTTEGSQGLTKYIGKHYKAIIGVQTYCFSIMMQDKSTNLHNLIIGPKFNMILDHPAWMQRECSQVPQDYYLLLHDRNYMDFSLQYYPNITGCIHFPPAGLLPDKPTSPMFSREYDISFVGTYYNYRERLTVLYTYSKTYRHLAARYLKIMRNNPDYPAEKALEKTLEYYHINLNTDDFLKLFYDMRQVYFCILLYYREKVIHTLLDAGLKIHVFSESWDNAPFHNHPCLFRHPKLDAAQCLDVMQNSRISLNIMSWHKDGLTERIFNSMLCQSVVLSDESTALQEEFTNSEDLVLFSLKELSTLPAQVMDLLSDNDRLEEIARNGYRKALNNHSWLKRAKDFLQLLDE